METPELLGWKRRRGRRWRVARRWRRRADPNSTYRIPTLPAALGARSTFDGRARRVCPPPAPVADDTTGTRRERLVTVDRGPFARQLDATLRALCLSEATAYRALGAVARELLRRRGHRRLGFVRVGDYARERLGISGRELETMACVARRLAGLPRIDAAFAAGALTWTQVRRLSDVATPETEDRWIAIAHEQSVTALDTLVKSALAAAPAAGGKDAAGVADAGGAADAAGADDTAGTAITADAADAAGAAATTGTATTAGASTTVGAGAGPGVGDVVDDDEDRDDPIIQVRLACPGRVRALFRRAVDLARAMSGAPVPLRDAVEAMAAEGLSGRNPAADGPDAPTVRPRHASGRSDGADAGAADSGASKRAAANVGAEMTKSTSSEPVPRPLLEALDAARDALTTLRDLAAPVGDRDAFDLDARLRRGRQVVATTAPRLGTLLRMLIDLRLYRYFDARSSDQYVRERLGFSTRKARALVKLDRRCAAGGPFAEAYRAGALSWVRAWTILPVIDGANAAAWVARAREVTVRHLGADVDCVLDARDRSGGHAPLDPPPLTGDPDPEEASTPACKSTARPADDSIAATTARESSRASAAPNTEVQFGAHCAVAGEFSAASGAPNAEVQFGAHCAVAGEFSAASGAPNAEVQFGAHCAVAGEFSAASGAPNAEVQFGAHRTAAGECNMASGVPNAEVQFGAYRAAADRGVDFAAWVCDGEIRFYAPASVVALVRRAIWAYSRPDEPRWRAVERWLGAVVAEWERQPRHPDPIFARDGWRCTVPACSSRGPFHDHHLHFRSRGGGNERGNRTAVCVAHHLHGIHAGHVRGWGLAPHAVRWQLGVRVGDLPLMELVGDRYIAAAAG
jgi:hypothetical protein